MKQALYIVFESSDNIRRPYDNADTQIPIPDSHGILLQTENYTIPTSLKGCHMSDMASLKRKVK